MDAVIVKGMEMPDNCEECRFCDYGERPLCAAMDGKFIGCSIEEGRRPGWCPLVKAPEE